MEDLLLEIGWNGIEHKVAQLESETFWDLPIFSNPPSEPSKDTAVWGKITGEISNQQDLMELLNNCKTDIENDMLSKFSSAFEYKGSVATKGDLPGDAKTGDVYRVEEDGKTYVYNGSSWDETSALDLSDYVKQSDLDTLLVDYYKKTEIDALIEDLRSAVEEALSSEINERKAEDEKLLQKINEVIVQFNNLASNFDSLEQNVNTFESSVSEKLTQYTTDITEIQQNITDLNQKIENTEVGDLSELKEQFTQLQQSFQELSDKVNNTDIGDLSEVQSTLAEVQSQLESLTTSLNEKADKTDLDKYVEKVIKTNSNTSYIANESNGAVMKYTKDDGSFGKVTLYDASDTDKTYIQLVASKEDKSEIAKLNISTTGIHYIKEDGVSASADNEIVTKADLKNIEAGEIPSLEDYAKKTDLDNYVKSADLPAQLEPYAKRDELDDFLTDADLVTKADKTELNNYVSKVIENTGNTAYINNETTGPVMKFTKADGSFGKITLVEDEKIYAQIVASKEDKSEIAKLDISTTGIHYIKEDNNTLTSDNEIITRNDIKTFITRDDLGTVVEDTVNEKIIPFKEEITTQTGNIQSLLLQLQSLEKRVEELKSLDPEVVILYENGDSEFTHKERDFVLSGAVNTTTNIEGNNVILKDTTITAATIRMLATQDVTIKNLTMTGVVPKLISNFILSIEADGYITMRDCNIGAESAYNGIEIGLTKGLAKSVTIDNIDFSGHLINNGINIFAMAENGIVTISNCHFASLSNVLRLSNRTNTHWTVNLINCTCDEWEKGQYSGMILMQDNFAKSQAEANENNVFNKLTINIQNFHKPDGTVLEATDLASICSTADDNQIFYMWDEYRNFTEYSPDVYPVINIQ